MNNFLFLFTKEMKIMRIIKNRKYVTKNRINYVSFYNTILLIIWIARNEKLYDVYFFHIN